GGAAIELRFQLGEADAEGPASVLAQEAGFAPVFQQVDGVRIHLAAGSDVLVDEVLAVDRDDDEIRVRVELELEEAERQARLDLDLLVSGSAVFAGGGDLVLRRGQTATTEVELEAVPAGVQVDDDVRTLDALGDTVQLFGTVVFATGDPIPDAGLQWTALDPEVLQVSSGGLATAAGEGTGRARGSFQEFSGTVAVEVAPVVVRVEVTPSAARVEPGETLQMEASALDRLDNPLPSPSVSWQSSAPDTATVDEFGVVTGRRPGPVTISATAEGESGSVDVEVDAVPPSVEALDALSVESGSARIRASVNPRGLPTQVRFRYGTDASLSDAGVSSPIARPDEITFSNVGLNIEGLSSNTTYYYRAEAESDAGSAEGEIRSFTTPIPLDPPSTPFVNWRAGQVELGWEAATVEGITFAVERGMVADGSPPASYSQVGTTSSLTFQDTPPEVGETWAYRVRTCQGPNCSDPSPADSTYVPRDVLYGFVTNQSGEPVPFASIFVGSSGEENFTSATTDGSGYYEIIADFNSSFDFLPTGTWFYDASASDGFAFGDFQVTSSPFIYQLDMVLDPSFPSER
ncbi:MAG: hypothetical protein EA352_11170, partial [Gemmatimonadales bacterium]